MQLGQRGGLCSQVMRGIFEPDGFRTDATVFPTKPALTGIAVDLQLSI